MRHRNWNSKYRQRQSAHFKLACLKPEIIEGTRVRGVWGAMHSESTGVVVKVETNGFEVMWDDETEVDFVSSIHHRGWRSANGSGIGVFVK